MSNDQFINCALPEYRDQCANLMWFGNLSDKTVRLEIIYPGTQLWTTIGTFLPGDRLDINPGALLVPQDAQLRAVDNTSSKTLEHCGRVGLGDKTFYVRG